MKDKDNADPVKDVPSDHRSHTHIAVKHEEEAREEEHETVGMKHGKKILLVEDDYAVRDAIKMLLEELGYDLELHVNGETILSGEYNVPDLFILDKQLPGVDGVDICQYVKSQTVSKHLPVIILSASPVAQKSAMTAGADGFLEKPFRKTDLLDLLHRLL